MEHLLGGNDMMRSRRLHLSCLISLALSVFGCAATAPSAAAPAAHVARATVWNAEMQPEDAALTSRVKAALQRVPSLRRAAITIESSRGVVWMGGTSVSRADRLTAVETTRKISGVVSIRNEMSFQD